MCNFAMATVPPEMGKIRHVVILSPRRRRNPGTYLIVPLSTVAPNPIEPYHYRIPANKYSFFKRNADIWVKGDMITNVSAARLDRVLDNGQYSSPILMTEDFLSIQLAVLEALGCGSSVQETVDVTETLRVIEITSEEP